MFLLLSILMECPVMADSPMTGNSPSLECSVRGSTVLRHHRSSAKYPNSPSLLSIECSYGDGFVKFDVPEGTQYLSVRIYNEYDEHLGNVNSENSILQIPHLMGEYNVECIDDSNRIFAGTIEF